MNRLGRDVRSTHESYSCDKGMQVYTLVASRMAMLIRYYITCKNSVTDRAREHPPTKQFCPLLVQTVNLCLKIYM